MTYISAFHSQHGPVMCADTQESWDEQKTYVEKISIVEDRSYPLAVGGAGFGDLIDCLADEIVKRASQEKPATKAALRIMLQEAVTHVYQNDAPTLVMGRQHRTPELIIAAVTGEGPAIFTTKGKRVLKEAKFAIVGYGTASNFALLKRMHRDNLPMQQAVILAVYLAALSKKSDKDVGGETRVVVVTQSGAWPEWQPYTENYEAHINHFQRLIDELFLASVDISIAPTKFPEVLQQFSASIFALRQSFLNQTSALSLQRVFSDPTYSGEPYPRIFPGAVINVGGDGGVSAREETEEERARLLELWKAAQEGNNQIALAQFNSWIQGKQIEFLGDEVVQVRGTAGPIASSEVDLPSA
ncbi:MAG: hypothetical protein ABSA85_11420 [Terracidiphilus sp.]